MKTSGTALELLGLELPQQFDQEEGQLDLSDAFVDLEQLVFELLRLFCPIR